MVVRDPERTSGTEGDAPRIGRPVDAVVESAIGLSVSMEAGRGWYFLSGLFSLFLGILVIAQWPASSIWAIGTMVGAGVLSKGITRIVTSSWVRSQVHQLQRSSAAA